MPAFRSCGLLTAHELEITEVDDAVALLEKLHSKTWSALEVTVAFCKRAAVAQQLVNCLMDIDFEKAMQRAKELDEHLRRTGKVVGPLHGLPVSIKVRPCLSRLVVIRSPCLGSKMKTLFEYRQLMVCRISRTSKA
jgi:amidase